MKKENTFGYSPRTNSMTLPKKEKKYIENNTLIMAKTLKVLPHDKERKNKLINIIFSSLIIINIVVGLLANVFKLF